MAKQNAYRNSKAIPNLQSATNITLRTTCNIVAKGIDKTAKWLVKEDARSTHRNYVKQRERIANHHLASMALSNRRLNRLSNNVHRIINTGKSDSTFEVAVGWLIDHAFHFWSLLWGFIWSMVTSLLMSIFSILLVIMFNVMFFYAIFWFLFL